MRKTIWIPALIIVLVASIFSALIIRDRADLPDRVIDELVRKGYTVYAPGEKPPVTGNSLTPPGNTNKPDTPASDNLTGTKINGKSSTIATPDGKASTFFIAAYNASDTSKSRADLVCSGENDQVVINFAFSVIAKLGTGGRVVLSEGKFIISTDILPPVDNITIEGQGKATILSDYGLETGHNVITIDGKKGITLKNLAIWVEPGLARETSAIVIKNGADFFNIDGVTVIESDKHAIYGTGSATTDGIVQNSTILETDTGSIDGGGIIIVPDPGVYWDRIRIVNNTVKSVHGTSIYIQQGRWSVIANNTVTGTYTQCGPSFGSGYGNSLTGNTSYYTSNGFDLSQESFTTVTGNVAYWSAAEGFNINGSHHVSGSGNLSYRSAFDGVAVKGGSHDIEWSGFVADSPALYGAYIYDLSENITLTGFTVTNATKGVYVWEASRVNLLGGSITSSTTGVEFLGTTVKSITNSQIVGVNISGCPTGIKTGAYTAGVVVRSNRIVGASVPVYESYGNAIIGDRLIQSPELDLSGAAADYTVFVAGTGNGQIVDIKVVYSEASSKDTGVEVRVGRYGYGITTDDNYFLSYTSEPEAALGSVPSFVWGLPEFSNMLFSINQAITVGTAGGKVGAGKVIVLLNIVDTDYN